MNHFIFSNRDGIFGYVAYEGVVTAPHSIQIFYVLQYPAKTALKKLNLGGGQLQTG